MLLADLYDQLAPSFRASVRKDLQTAVGVLAKALQCADPRHCHPEHYQQPLSQLSQLVHDYLTIQGKSPHTIRNTKNNLSRLFRRADEQGLCSLIPVTLPPRYNSRYQTARPCTYTPTTEAYYLRFAHWPPALQQAFLAFQTWASHPFIVGRGAHHRKRLSTVNRYQRFFEGYFGYLQHVVQIVPTFEHLFDLDAVTTYVQWHVNTYHGRPTVTIRDFLNCLTALTAQYRPMPELHAQLLALKKTLPVPTPTFRKEDAWVSLATLENIAQQLWPKHKPKDLRQSPGERHGNRLAVRAGMALMLRLWTYIPYRQRNMREMELGKHLHKDAHGQWRITFRDEELKIATKRGRSNVFDLPFPPTLVPLMEEYLAVWRPRLHAPEASEHPHVFLTQYGTPYNGPILRQTTKAYVYRYTGKHWHPHIVRSVWATEWIRKTHGDFYTAAIMLNDTLETVISTYAHLMEEDVAEKAYRLIDERNGQGK